MRVFYALDMPGTVKMLGVALLATATAALTPAAATASTAATTTSLETVRTHGASASAAISYFTITGTAFPTRINAYLDGAGRLTLVSPEGITAPSSPTGVCSQDSPAQVSCNPGAVTAIKGDLLGGADTFTASPTLTLAIGLKVTGPDSPLVGGGGRDLLIGGAEGDLIGGGPGPDTIDGLGGDDVLHGGAGKDDLDGGPGPDALFGDGGADKLIGGAARDLCVGGAGIDIGRSCLVRRGIP